MGNRNSRSFSTSRSASLSTLPYKLGSTSYASGARSSSLASTSPQQTPRSILRNEMFASPKRATSLGSINDKSSRYSERTPPARKPSGKSLKNQVSFKKPPQRQSSVDQPTTPRQYNDDYLQNDIKKLFKAHDKSNSKALVDDALDDNSAEGLDKKLATLKKQRKKDDVVDGITELENSTLPRKSRKSKKAPQLPPSTPTVNNVAGKQSLKINGVAKAESKTLQRKKTAPAPPPPPQAPPPSDEQSELLVEEAPSKTSFIADDRNNNNNNDEDEQTIAIESATKHIIPSNETESASTKHHDEEKSVAEAPHLHNGTNSAKVAIERELKTRVHGKNKKAAPKPSLPPSDALDLSLEYQPDINTADRSSDKVTGDAELVELPIEKKEIAVQYDAPVDMAIQCDGKTLRVQRENDEKEKLGNILKRFISKNAEKDAERNADESSLDSNDILAELEDVTRSEQSMEPLEETEPSIDNLEVGESSNQDNHNSSEVHQEPSELMINSRIEADDVESSTPTAVSAETAQECGDDLDEKTELHLIVASQSEQILTNESDVWQPSASPLNSNDSGHEEPSDISSSTTAESHGVSLNLHPNLPVIQPATIEGTTNLYTNGANFSESHDNSKEAKKHKSKYSGIFRITKTMRSFMSSIGKSSTKPATDQKDDFESDKEVSMFSTDNWTLSGRGKTSPARKEYHPTWDADTFQPQGSESKLDNQQFDGVAAEGSADSKDFPVTLQVEDPQSLISNKITENEDLDTGLTADASCEQSADYNPELSGENDELFVDHNHEQPTTVRDPGNLESEAAMDINDTQITDSDNISNKNFSIESTEVSGSLEKSTDDEKDISALNFVSNLAPTTNEGQNSVIEQPESSILSKDVVADDKAARAPAQIKRNSSLALMTPKAYGSAPSIYRPVAKPTAIQSP